MFEWRGGGTSANCLSSVSTIVLAADRGCTFFGYIRENNPVQKRHFWLELKKRRCFLDLDFPKVPNAFIRFFHDYRTKARRNNVGKRHVCRRLLIFWFDYTNHQRRCLSLQHLHLQTAPFS